MTDRLTALASVPYEPDQVKRLDRYRAAYPHVVIGADEYGHWQAVIPSASGERTAIRHSLAELLDWLDALPGEQAEGNARG